MLAMAVFSKYTHLFLRGENILSGKIISTLKYFLPVHWLSINIASVNWCYNLNLFNPCNGTSGSWFQIIMPMLKFRDFTLTFSNFSHPFMDPNINYTSNFNSTKKSLQNMALILKERICLPWNQFYPSWKYVCPWNLNGTTLAHETIQIEAYRHLRSHKSFFLL